MTGRSLGEIKTKIHNALLSFENFGIENLQDISKTVLVTTDALNLVS